MLPIVSIPELVQHYAPAYRTVFTEAQYKHFQRYLSGLLICEHKTISRINEAFILDPLDQSTLNRFLTQSRYEVSDLNAIRLGQLQTRPATRMRIRGRKGVLGIDDTLLVHVGKHIEEVSKLWDHANDRYVLAHNLVNLYYSDDRVDYPIDFELWEPPDVEVIESGLQALGVPMQAGKEKLKKTDPVKWRKYLLGLCKRRLSEYPALGALYQTKVVLAMELLGRFFQQYPEHDLPIAFDTWYTTPQMCSYIDQELKRGYLGALKLDKAQVLRANKTYKPIKVFIQELKVSQLKGEKTHFHYTYFKVKGQEYSYYTYCRTHQINNYGKVRVLISFQNHDLSDEPKVYISNKLDWPANSICRIYRHRWPVEPFHQEAKLEGLDKYQIRKFPAVRRHIAYVLIIFSMLTMARKDEALLKKLQLTPDATEQSLAFWRRISQAHMLIAQWSMLALEKGLSWEKIIQTIFKAYF